MKSLVYGIQEHNADKAGLHYDLKLQDPSNSKMAISFVIKKKPVLKCCKTRLAIQQKLHDLSFLYFQGKKVGDTKDYDGGTTGYGKGKYKLFDIGTYELIEKTQHKYYINIKGQVLKGEYYLIKVPRYISYSSTDDKWFFRKKKAQVKQKKPVKSTKSPKKTIKIKKKPVKSTKSPKKTIKIKKKPVKSTKSSKKTIKIKKKPVKSTKSSKKTIKIKKKPVKSTKSPKKTIKIKKKPVKSTKSPKKHS